MDKQREISLRSRPWSRHPEKEAASSGSSPEFAAFNQRIHDELSSIPVPPDLRERILASRKVIRPERWRKERLLAMAAAILLLGTGLFFWLRPREDQSVAGFRSRMVGFAVREYRMDVFTPSLATLRQFLSSKNVPSDFSLPPRLSATPLKGGASLSWQGKPVSMVCFDWPDRETLYMFVLPEEQAATTPAITHVKGLATATWSREGKTFVLAGRVPEDQLAELTRF